MKGLTDGSPTEAMHPGDAELIRRYLDGDPEAVEALDDWIQRASWPYRQRLGTDWEDLVQDVRLELVKLLGRGQFRGEARLRTFVWRVSVNASISRLRARRQYWVDLEEVTETLQDEGLLARPASRGEGERDLVQRVAARASEECRRLWMMILAGLSRGEMGERLGIAEGTVRVRVHRCRRDARRLREELLGADADVGIGADPETV